MPFFGVPLRNGVPIGLGSVAGFGTTPFSPAELFYANEPGVWYDPSDFSTLFQDVANTPVTALEQPVGLVLDKTRGLVLGNELVTNGDFSSGTTGWTLPAGWSISGGTANVNSSSGPTQITCTSFSSVVGKTYKASFTIVSVSGTGVRLILGGVVYTGFLNTPGTYTFYMRTTTTASVAIAAGSTNTIASIDNVSVRELPGSHASQTTAASRPVLSARYNLFVNTATLATQNVTTVATDYTLRFEGTGSIALSGTASGTYSAGTHTVTCTAGTLTATVTGSVTNADIRVANDGAGIPSYQFVGAAIPGTSTSSGTPDYDTSGFPTYLRFDGDSLNTSNVDFSGTDTVAVFAGLRKLSDAGQGVVVELTANIASNNGAFLLAAPDAASATFAWDSKGTSQVDAVASSQTAPITAVLTGTADIGDDTCVLRVNGAQADSDTGDQGAGNYASAPLNIGQRSGGTLHYNGRLYSLIVRGAATTDAQIAATEAWVNNVTKAY